MYKEEIRKESYRSDEEFAQTIKEIERNTTKPSTTKNTFEQKKNIFFEHPLKTMDASLKTIQGRGFLHLAQKSKEGKPINIIQTDKFDLNSIRNDNAPTLKEIESNMSKLDLQK